MANEIELKLVLAATDQRRFLRHPLLSRARARSDQILDNTYFDTPELALRGRGIGLRIRKQGRERLQTVKIGGQSVAGLSIRPEWETPYRGQFDFSSVELALVREWLQTPEVLTRLGPVFRTRFRRITWYFPLPAGGEVLLALDRGAVISGGHEATICEVELELAGSEDVTQLKSIADTLAARIPLMPSAVSKAQRGYALLHRTN